MQRRGWGEGDEFRKPLLPFIGHLPRGVSVSPSIGEDRVSGVSWVCHEVCHEVFHLPWGVSVSPSPGEDRVSGVSSVCQVCHKCVMKCAI